MGDLSFELLREADGARAGLLTTPHGTLETPVFFPVATYGAIRGLAPWELERAHVQGVLCNTYHLHLRPGEQRVAALGGLHGFLQWKGPILTDSGGFQLHSLDEWARIDESGVEFQSPIDGSRHFLSPERCIEIQEALGADLIVTLDQFEPAQTQSADAESRARACLERTLRWAERCQRARRRSDQWLFGIVQGGGFDALRRESAERTCALGFDAYAIGGLGLAEDAAQRHRLVQASVSALPRAVPRYLMGIGKPEDIVEAVARGVDLFDCVLPTRHGRHAAAYTSNGLLHLRNAQHAGAEGPLDAACDCACCRSFSRGYLHHLFKVGEALGGAMISLHNIRYYMRLLHALRKAILAGDAARWLERWRAGQREPEACSSASAAAHSPA